MTSTDQVLYLFRPSTGVIASFASLDAVDAADVHRHHPRCRQACLPPREHRRRRNRCRADAGSRACLNRYSFRLSAPAAQLKALRRPGTRKCQALLGADRAVARGPPRARSVVHSKRTSPQWQPAGKKSCCQASLRSVLTKGPRRADDSAPLPSSQHHRACLRAGAFLDGRRESQRSTANADSARPYHEPSSSGRGFQYGRSFPIQSLDVVDYWFTPLFAGDDHLGLPPAGRRGFPCPGGRAGLDRRLRDSVGIVVVSFTWGWFGFAWLQAV